MKHNKKELLAKKILITNLIRERVCLLAYIDSSREDRKLDSKKLNHLKNLLVQLNKKESNKQKVLDQLSIQVAELATKKDSKHISVSHATVVLPRAVNSLQHSFKQLKKLSAGLLPKQEIEAIISCRAREWMVAIKAVVRDFFLFHRQELASLELYSVSKKNKNSPYSLAKSMAATSLGSVIENIKRIDSETTSKNVDIMIKSIVILVKNLEKATQIKNSANAFFSHNHRGGKIGMILHDGLDKIVQTLRGYKHFLKKREDAIKADQIRPLLLALSDPAPEPRASIAVQKEIKLTLMQWSPIHFQLAPALTEEGPPAEDRYERKR